MNQRSRNRRRHAAVLFGQLIERRNGRRIAQYHGDLPATRNAGGLALGAGLGLGHESVSLSDFGHADIRGALFSEQVHHVKDGIATARGRNVIRNGLQLTTFRSGVGANHAVVVHGSTHHLAHVLNALTMRLPAGQLFGYRLAAFLGGCCDGEQALFSSDADKLPRLFTKACGKGAALSKNLVHDLLPSGPIPPMSESYAVTSDVSTGIRRNFA